MTAAVMAFVLAWLAPAVAQARERPTFAQAHLAAHLTLDDLRGDRGRPADRGAMPARRKLHDRLPSSHHRAERDPVPDPRDGHTSPQLPRDGARPSLRADGGVMTRRPWHEVLDGWVDAVDGWATRAYRGTGPLGWLRSSAIGLAAVVLGLAGMLLAFVVAVLLVAVVVTLAALAVLLVARFVGL